MDACFVLLCGAVGMIDIAMLCCVALLIVLDTGFFVVLRLLCVASFTRYGGGYGYCCVDVG